jgi:tetratricopeptide (TPR) repeat protein
VLSNLGLLAYYMNDLSTAIKQQESALKIAQEFRSLEVESLAWLRLGRALVEKEKLLEAGEAFRNSLGLRHELGRINLVPEPLSGLARVSLALGELEDAREFSEEILAILDLPFSNLLDNADDPYWVYLSCVLVLRADQDPRAPAILMSAYKQLQAQAEQIGNETLRAFFLEKIPWNRALIRDWERENESS